MVQGERGIALVAVLAFLAVMSIIALGAIGSARTSVQGASRALLRTQAQAAIDSAINQGVAELVAARTFMPNFAVAPQTLTIGGFQVTVAARSESTKVDINYADATLLAILFRAGGADADKAAALASAVEDWRDGDDLLHVNGAEKVQYADAGLGYAPANAFFRSIDEMRQVIGVTQPLFDCLRPQMTIFSQRQGIDIDHAAPMIRRAAGAEERAGFVDGDPITEQTIAPGEAFEITARLDDRKLGIKRAERVVVRITGNPRDPYWLLASEALNPIEEAARRSCPQTSVAALGEVR